MEEHFFRQGESEAYGSSGVAWFRPNIELVGCISKHSFSSELFIQPLIFDFFL